MNLQEFHRINAVSGVAGFGSFSHLLTTNSSLSVAPLEINGDHKAPLVLPTPLQYPCRVPVPGHSAKISAVHFWSLRRRRGSIHPMDGSVWALIPGAGMGLGGGRLTSFLISFQVKMPVDWFRQGWGLHGWALRALQGNGRGHKRWRVLGKALSKGFLNLCSH